MTERGIELAIELIEEVEGNGCEAEKKWIAEYRKRGYPLVNGTDGGEGILGHVFSEKSRKKMSESQRAHVTEEQRAWGRELGRRSWEKKTEAEKKEWVTRMKIMYRAKYPKKVRIRPTPEETARRLSVAIKAWHASRPLSARSAVAKKSYAVRKQRIAENPERYKRVRTEEQRAAHRLLVKSSWAKLTPEQKAKRQFCMHEGKRNKRRQNEQTTTV